MNFPDHYHSRKCGCSVCRVRRENDANDHREKWRRYAPVVTFEVVILLLALAALVMIRGARIGCAQEFCLANFRVCDPVEPMYDSVYSFSAARVDDGEQMVVDIRRDAIGARHVLAKIGRGTCR